MCYEVREFSREGTGILFAKSTGMWIKMSRNGNGNGIGIGTREWQGMGTKSPFPPSSILSVVMSPLLPAQVVV